MVDDTENNNARIKPAAIALTRLADDTVDQDRRPLRRSLVIGLGLAGLAILVFAVIFILPDRLEFESAVTPIPANNNDTAVRPAAAGNLPSPWTEAQLAKQRKETQDILSQMLKHQDALEQIGVTQWAQQDYEQALQFGVAGDALYRQREFIQARDNYQQGLDALERLLELSETEFNAAIARGYQAIADGHADAARTAFQLALLIKPDAESAIHGRQRAETLDQVLELLRQADSLLAADQLEAAAEGYKQVLSVDPDASSASDRLTDIRSRIVDRDFTAAMSAGYAALESNKLDAARKSFQQAIKIKPGTQEARHALQQTENRLTVIDINKLLTTAREHEQEERWSHAESTYDQALKLDANLSMAQTGKQNAALRAALDQRLQYALANPMRLSEQSVYNEVRALYRQAENIQGPGQKLNIQLSGLKRLLDRARIPLPVMFHSDNLTEVTLYKTGSFGLFTTRQESLIPGQYVVVGRRKGYKDVRVEFTVDPDKPIPPIVVQCEEKAAL